MTPSITDSAVKAALAAIESESATYANTISNKANALCNLPDNPEYPETGNRNNLLQACAYYQQAQDIFTHFGQVEQTQMVAQSLKEIEIELQEF